MARLEDRAVMTAEQKTAAAAAQRGSSQARKVVVVHRGARDGYQVASGLAEAGSLETLVTDLYWPGDRAWAQRLGSWLPTGASQALRARFNPCLPSAAVRWALPSGPVSFLMDKVRRLSFERRRAAQRWTDAELGRMAGRLARRKGAQLLSYSYYGYHAFREYGRPGVLFQVHPHPVSVRRLLGEELERHPECAASLQKEWELSLPAEDFARLAAEPAMASHLICASSFTRQTLLENGADARRIRVAPYGVDTNRFQPRPRGERRKGKDGKLQLLFVGTINQRKGIKYLLEAVRQVKSRQVELVVCGRVVDDLQLFRPLGEQVQVRPSVSESELQAAYGQADLFVFPSIVEGFAQVLLESLSCGLPVLSTTHTAAPDLIDEGIQGFVVEPRRPDLLAERIDWIASHRDHLDDMREAARRRAMEFSWARFRRAIAQAMGEFSDEADRREETAHV